MTDKKYEIIPNDANYWMKITDDRKLRHHFFISKNDMLDLRDQINILIGE